MQSKLSPTPVKSAQQPETSYERFQGVHKVNFRQQTPTDIDPFVGVCEDVAPIAMTPIVQSEKAPALPAPKQRVKPASLVKTPIPWSRDDPSLVFPKNFFGGNDKIHPIDFVHGGGFGATGAGKTVGLVLPFVETAIAFSLHDGTPSAVVVVDPKKEIAEHIARQFADRGEPNRLFTIGEGPPIQLFPVDCELGAADRHERLRELSPQESQGDSNRCWTLKADALLINLIQLELTYKKKCGERFLQVLVERVGDVMPPRGGPYWEMVRALLAYITSDRKNLRQVAGAIKDICDEQDIAIPSVRLFSSYLSGETHDQLCYVVMSTEATVNALCDPQVADLVNLDVIGNAVGTNIKDLIDASKVIVFQPEPTTAGTVATKAFKQRFFEAVYSRENLRQPVFFVVDEYQTFVGAKDTSLLDRARGYRAIALLASQSLAALQNALRHEPSANNIVETLVANLPSRFSFRSNCVDTARWLKSQIPDIASGPHILEVRRLSMLRPGEAYFMLANGTWGFDRPSLAPAA